MHRAIKFRAWTGKKMMYQDKQYLGSFIRRVVMQVMLDHGMDEPREHETYLPKGTVIDDYLLQFTGLLDKNGKEIYEADIARFSGKQGVVKWNTSKPEFYVYGPDGVDWELHGDWEVIGNIHETREAGTQP